VEGWWRVFEQLSLETHFPTIKRCQTPYTNPTPYTLDFIKFIRIKKGGCGEDRGSQFEQLSLETNFLTIKRCQTDSPYHPPSPL
jgi:hypothetical protein